MSFEGINLTKNNPVEKKSPEYVELSYDEERIVKEFLGNHEQIYKKVAASLDALDRGQAGSYEIGKPMFYKTMIEAGTRKIKFEELKLCEAVIDHYVDKIRKQQEWQNEADEYLDKKAVDEKRRDLENRDAVLYGDEHERFDK